MSALLDQFLSEARDFIQGIGEKLLQLETAPQDVELLSALFRLVHTLKGNSGLFDFPEMTRVLHAAEDLMDAVRDGRVGYSRNLADQLLEAMDFVGVLLDDIATTETISAGRAPDAHRLGVALRGLIAAVAPHQESAPALPLPAEYAAAPENSTALFAVIPEAQRLDFYRQLRAGATLYWVSYSPEAECFYKGEDPLFQVLQLPAQCWRRVQACEAWPPLLELDAYRCLLQFQWVTSQDAATLTEHFRYTPEQIAIVPLTAPALMLPHGRDHDRALAEEFLRVAQVALDNSASGTLLQASRTLLELSAPDLWLASLLRWMLLVLEGDADLIAARHLLDALRQHDAIAPAPIMVPPPRSINADATWSFNVVLEAQREILSLTDAPSWLAGRLRAVATSLAGAFASVERDSALASLDVALTAALATNAPAPLLAWLDAQSPLDALITNAPSVGAPNQHAPSNAASTTAITPAGKSDEEAKFGRRADDTLPGPRMLKVDQTKIDRMMDLIGEMVVAKNALPYLAGRAESVFGVRELAREIKTQYSVINRIAEDMRDAIMQVRLLPVAFVFQRFPRLVRDLAHKLGKDVRLVMEGETTEADKNIIEALADPLVHIVRNSLDHGLETPSERRAAGKPEAGRLSIVARQAADRVLIEITDDGRGIDPALVRRKAYARGLIDEVALERLSDQEAVNLVFAAGFSTAEQVSDVSGRGVGMDVVRSALVKVNGGVTLTSEVGRGTRLCLSLPLSMTVTNVMIIDSAGQRFGVPVDAVAETVRVPQQQIRIIKHQWTTVLRGRVVPLMALNDLLGLGVEPLANSEGEYAVLVVRIDQDALGVIVDNCRETVDIILKPLAGMLGGLNGYAGSALLGDGSVLLVLNPKDLI